jgi:site-specific recombinase XerD
MMTPLETAPMLNPTLALEHPMSPPFAALVDKVEDRYGRSFLRRFFCFASSCGVAPEDVDEAVLAGFDAEVLTAGINRPKQVVRDAVKTWNRMAVTIEGWPQRRLPLTARGWVALPMSAFPDSFRQDCEAFLNRSEGLGLFDERGLRKLSDVTKGDRRHKLRQLATRLVEAGRPPESIKRLADLVEPQAVESILLPMWNEEPTGKNAHASNLARLMALIAQHWAFRLPEEVMRIKAAEARLRPSKQGMTDRNRAKLRHLIEPERLRSLVNLPFAVFKEVDSGRPTVLDAVLVQSALAVAILMIAPMREKNLAALDIDRHVHRVSDEVGYIVISGHEVKNERDLEYPLSIGTLRILDLYLKIYRPLLLKKARSSKLFISWSGRQKRPHELGAQIPKLIRERLGLDVNVHLFRHLAGYLFLREHPGEYEPVRQLLGHKSLATTIAFYTGLEHADSFRRYDQVLDSYRDTDHAT